MSLDETGLPEEVRHLIISQLSYPDIIRIYRTSTLYEYIIQDAKLWDSLLDRDFPGIKNYFSQFPFADKSNHDRYKILYWEIDKVTRQSMKKYNFINSRYVNREAIYDDVFNLLYKILLMAYKDELSNEEINIQSHTLLSILSGLNEKIYWLLQ